MIIRVNKSIISGDITIPGSKSHTIRALALAAMANGTSTISNALYSDDTISCLDSIRKLGAIVKENQNIVIEGLNGEIKNPQNIDVGNSGTSLRILTALAALSDKTIQFDGDASIRTRPMAPLLNALSDLGANVTSTNGKCPFTVTGPISGGKTIVDGISSQFLTALLFAAPLASNDTEITVENLHEQPYVEITLDWLEKLNIQYQRKGFNWFKIPGGQQYQAFNRAVPADFSSATFALCAAAITQSEITIKGLDFNDHQGDKETFTYLEKMGTKIKHTSNGVVVSGERLKGIDIDMNATPDALPAIAVAACFAEGTTRLLNVKQARLKECDRIKAMYTELSKMGAKVHELEDGLVIEKSKLQGTNVHGYHDHRMVMSLALAGMNSEGETIIDTAESVSVTYPSFIDDFNKIGAKITKNN